MTQYTPLHSYNVALFNLQHSVKHSAHGDFIEAQTKRIHAIAAEIRTVGGNPNVVEDLHEAMTVKTSKDRFRTMQTLSRKTCAELAGRFNETPRMLEMWRRPSDRTHPPAWAVTLMEAIWLEVLREDAKTAGFDLTPRRAD